MSEINVMFCGNYRVVDGILLSLLSMAKNSKSTINAYLITMDLTDINETYKPLTEENRFYIEEAIKSESPLSKVILLDVTKEFNREFLQSPNLNSKYTPYCLLRLFADVLNIPKKIIYLDADTMVNLDISQLYEMDIKEYELGAVIDHLGKTFKYKTYFNSGVLLLNMEKIKETKLLENARELIKNKKLPYPDQDALNYLAKYTLVLPSIYNEQRKMNEKTVIKHFCKGIIFFPFHIYNIKPWEIEKVHKKLKIHYFDDIYEKYNQIKLRRK